MLSLSVFWFTWSWNKSNANALLYAELIALGVLFTYNFDAIRKFIDGFENSEKSSWFENNNVVNKALMIISFLGIAFIYVFYSTFFFSVLLKLIIVLSIYLFYTFFNGRKIPMLKMWLIALTWAYLVTLENTIYESLKLIPLFLSLAIFSDCKDISIDDKFIKTLPQQIGVKAAKWIGIVLYLIFIVTHFYDTNKFSLSIAIIALYSIYLLQFQIKKTELKHISLVDSTLILLAFAQFINEK